MNLAIRALPLVFMAIVPLCGRAQALNNPLAAVLNQADLSTLGPVYQESVQPGALLVVDSGGRRQFPDPVKTLATMKVTNEGSHMAHASINLAQSKNFFLSLLSFDPSVKLTKAASLEVFETDFTLTRITDGQMNQLVYHDPEFAKTAKDALDGGDLVYLVESVWFVKSLTVTQSSSSGAAVSSGMTIPACSAQPAPATRPQNAVAQPPAAPAAAPALPASTPPAAHPSAPAPQSGSVASVEGAVTTSVKSLSNAITNAVDATSKAVANATATPVQAGFEVCSGQNALLELNSARAIPIAVKLQRIIKNTQQPSGIDFTGDVRNF